MSELNNPLFDEEKEFLERKKLEYERALRGDVDHLKDQGLVAGKVALVGAGLAGGIWLITKAVKGKKGKNRYAANEDEDFDGFDDFDDSYDDEDFDGLGYYTDGQGNRRKSQSFHRSAAESASVFMQHEQGEVDDLGFGASAGVLSGAGAGHAASADSSYGSSSHGSGPLGFDDMEDDEEDDPFRELPYDDSRRLPTSHEFDGHARHLDGHEPGVMGEAVKQFLQSQTGKVIVAQVAAVALAFVTKKISEFFPADKNADLATAPGYAPSETGFSPVASTSLASPDSPDASLYPKPS
jgi:hypothetical protein